MLLVPVLSIALCVCVCVSLVTQLCLTLCDAMDCSAPASFVHGDSPGKLTEVDCHGIFLTRESS